MNVGPLPPQQPGVFGFGDATAAAAAYYPSSYPPPAQQHQQHQHQQTPTPTQAFTSVPHYANPHGANYIHPHALGTPPAGDMMPQHQQQPNNGPSPYAFYTSAPYSTAVPAQVPLTPTSAPAPAPLPTPQPAQHIIPQHDLRHSQSASPLQRQPTPNAAPQPTNHSTPPTTKYPMAAPPLPQSPASHQPMSANAASPKTPSTPGPQSREQQRVALILDINADMLREVHRLQLAGKGGAINPQRSAELEKEGKPAQPASEEYVQLLRRIQANLAYLMPKAQGDATKAVPGPAYMSPPPHMPQLQAKYDQLKELFPDWPGLEHRVSHASPKPVATGNAQTDWTSNAITT